jgi:RND family efflux transporter MFP subunit
MSMTKVTGAGVAASLATWGLTQVWHQRFEAAAPAPAAAVAPAPAQPASPLNDTTRVWATGKVEAWKEATVSSKVPGRIETYHAHEGDVVKTGQPIVTLERRRQQAELDRALARRDQAQRDLARANKLSHSKVMSIQEREAAETSYKAAAADVNAYTAALEDHVVRAPFAGTLLQTYREEGESVAPGTPLFAIGDLSTFKVRSEVDELEIAQVQTGARARVWPDAAPDKLYSGIVSRMSGMLGRRKIDSDDPSQRADAHVLEVEVKLDDGADLRPGMTVRVAIDPK